MIRNGIVTREYIYLKIGDFNRPAYIPDDKTSFIINLSNSLSCENDYSNVTN